MCDEMSFERLIAKTRNSRQMVDTTFVEFSDEIVISSKNSFRDIFGPISDKVMEYNHSMWNHFNQYHRHYYSNMAFISFVSLTYALLFKLEMTSNWRTSSFTHSLHLKLQIITRFLTYLTSFYSFTWSQTWKLWPSCCMNKRNSITYYMTSTMG